MMIGPNFLVPRPHVPEYDFSGVVLDENESGFVLGDSVYGYIPTATRLSTRQGSLSQYIRVPSSCLVKRPFNITAVEAAGITLCALTAYQALHHIAKVEPEQTVFINGGSCASGAFAIQIAKAKGARVVATASAKNEQVIRSLGADEVLRSSTRVQSLISTLIVH
jgi:NADPH:quinone reductase-like Zn-dependent oxidoreductase